MQVSHYKLMYQLQEKTERSAPPFCVSGGKNLKHILVYSCAGGWISYTAGSMLFVVKSYKAKKCNNGADHSLCLVSFVFLCNGKTIYRVQIFVRIVSKKKGLEKQIQTSNTNVYLWENYLKLPSFSSHTAWQNCPKKKKKSYWHNLLFFFFTMTTLQSRSFWTGWKLQRETATCVTTWSALRGKTKTKKLIGSLSLFRLGPGVVTRIFFWQNQAYIRPFTFLLRHQCSQLLKTFLRLEPGEKLQLPSHYYSTVWWRQASDIEAFWNVKSVFCLVLECPRCSGSGGAR